MTMAGVLRKVLNRCFGRQSPPRLVVRRVEAAARRRMQPGFIIGVYRSGTTLLRYVLDSHPNIAVPPESNFIDSLADLWRDEWYRRGLRGVGLDEQELEARLRDFVWGIFDDYALAKGKGRWFDKTPSYAEQLDFLDRLFGSECRYIMLYRHGLDVATSLTRMQQGDVNKGPGRRYAQQFDSVRVCNAAYWADLCEGMLAFEAAHPEQCFRLRYEDYASDPQRTLPPLFAFLGEPWQDLVLRFADHDHDAGLQDGKILQTRDFKPNTGTWQAWSAAELTAARQRIAPTLEKLGYS